MDKTKLAVVQVALEDINTHIVLLMKWLFFKSHWYPEAPHTWINVCVILPKQQKVTLGLHWSMSGGECLYILDLRHDS